MAPALMLKVYYGVNSSRFKGASFSKPVLTAKTSSSIIGMNYSHNVVIDGLELRGLYIGPAANIWGASSITLDTCTDILFKNLLSINWKRDAVVTDDDANGGIYFNSHASSTPVNVIVDSCEISNAEWSSIKNNGVAVRGVQTILNSRIHDVPTVGLHVADVHDNIFYNIDYPMKDFDQSGRTTILIIPIFSILMR